jgi:hypothetical protein
MDRFETWVDMGVGIDVAVGVRVDVDAGVGVEVYMGVGVSVRISVGVNEDVSVRSGVTDRMITVDVADGMKRGVGERIAGKGDGGMTGVVTAKEIFPALQATSMRPNVIAGKIFVMLILQSG